VKNTATKSTLILISGNYRCGNKGNQVIKGTSRQVNKLGDSQRECDKVKRVQVVRCATLGSSFLIIKNQNIILTIIIIVT
jgi:hypothetical protein